MDPYARLIRIQEALRDGGDVLLNFYQERTPKKMSDKQAESLRKDMQAQNAAAVKKTIAKHGTEIVPQPKPPKPISFR